jgi:hypothetical protein
MQRANMGTTGSGERSWTALQLQPRNVNCPWRTNYRNVCAAHTQHKAVGNICKSTMTRYEPCSRVFSSSPSLPLLCSACTSRCRGEAAYAEAGSSVKGRQYGPVIERRVQSWPCSSRRSGSSRLEPKVGSEVVSSQEGLDVAPTFPTDIRARTRSDIGLSVDGEAGTTSATAQIVES